MWTRPAGPPNVWRVQEITDSSGMRRKFSIQEIPEDRYEEVLDFMCSVYLKDEFLSAMLDLINDPPSIAANRKIWELALAQGISVAAFEILENNAKPVLAAVNVLVHADAEMDKMIESMKGEPTKNDKIFKFWQDVIRRANPRKAYNVDGFIEGYGFTVDPNYRKLGLGTHILEIRDQIGRMYDVEYTSTLFSSRAGQRTAEKAGFTTDLERFYDDAVEDDGSHLFPPMKGMSGKVMAKRIALTQQ